MSFVHDYVGLFLLTGLFLCILVLFIFNEVFQNFILPLYSLIEETNLIATINPSHRITAQGAQELGKLAQSINKTAENLENSQRKLHKYTRHVNATLEEEKNRLAKVIATFPVGVVVCNSCGEILLYNQRAKEVLTNGDLKGAKHSALKGHIGLGRSIFDLCDHNLFSRINETLNMSVQSPRACQEQRFTATGSHDTTLYVHLVPLFSRHKRLTGFTCLFDIQRDESSVCLKKSHSDHLQQDQPKERVKNGAFDDETNGCFYDFFLADSSFSRFKDIEEKPLKELSYTVFDLETTGLRPDSGDAIISISAVRIVNSKIIFDESFNQLIDPKRSIPEDSIRIHGIRPELIQGQPVIEQVLPQFHQFVQETVLVAHNIDFDLRFLRQKEHQFGLRFDNPMLDILLLSALVHPYQEDHRLEGIAQRLGTKVYARHTSFGDAMTAAEILLYLLPLLEDRGISTLKQATITSQRNKVSKSIL
jgi:DNA polymerase III epsilon subunit family exonuclease